MSSTEDNDNANASMAAFTSAKPRRRLLGLAALVAVLAGGWWYWQNSRDQQDDAAPLVATVERGSIVNTIASAGSLKPSRFIDVGAQVSGILQNLYVEVGDVVEQGQLLAEIDARVQQARVDASRANIASQEAQLSARAAALDLARANAERQTRLMEADATSQLEYDNAMNNLASAEAGLVQLQRQIEQSLASLYSEETQLEFTRIFAPTEGTVVSIEMSEGRTLNAVQMAPTILRIADLSTMTVEADISEADIGSIKRGMNVYFTTLGNGDRRWYATLRQILPTPTVVNNVVLYTGLFDIGNEDGSLFSEMTAQVYFITSQAENVLTVPLGALSFADQPGASAAAAFTAADMSGERAEEMRARIAERIASGEGPPAGFTPPAGFAGFAGAAAGNGPRTAGGPRPASVTVLHPDGTREQRQVLVGLTSRVAAEILSGLKEGEQVVAGIMQSGAGNTSQQNQQMNFRGPPGGFGGGFRAF